MKKRAYTHHIHMQCEPVWNTHRTDFTLHYILLLDRSSARPLSITSRNNRTYLRIVKFDMEFGSEFIVQCLQEYVYIDSERFTQIESYLRDILFIYMDESSVFV